MLLHGIADVFLGRLLDRIDLHVEVPRLPLKQLYPDAPAGESSATVRKRVNAACTRQHTRCGKINARLTQHEMHTVCRLSPSDQVFLERAIDNLQLSARSMHRVLRVARTIADLDDCTSINNTHLTEALGYRNLDRSHPC